MNRMKMTTLAVLGAFAAAAHADAGTAAYADEARPVAKALAQRLGAELKKALSEQGAPAAIAVCSKAAPSLAAELSAANGGRVTRVSLRARDALLGSPDAWEQKALADFAERQARGEAVDSMEVAEIVTEPQGRYFRYLKPLATQELCLTCHGPRDTLAPAVREALSKSYPHDAAVGYSLGQVRGAISIKRPL